MPGTPPGMSASRKASRNQKELTPKNVASPPQTPAKTRLLFERRKDSFCTVITASNLNLFSLLFTMKIGKRRGLFYFIFV
jgi:hypothetical protein